MFNLFKKQFWKNKIDENKPPYVDKILTDIKYTDEPLKNIANYYEQGIMEDSTLSINEKQSAITELKNSVIYIENKKLLS